MLHLKILLAIFTMPEFHLLHQPLHTIIATLLFLLPLYNDFLDLIFKQMKVIQLSQRYMLELFVREHGQLVAFEQDLNVAELNIIILALGT